MAKLKPLCFVLFLFPVFFSFGQDLNLLDGITLNDRNREANLMVTFADEAMLNSAYDRGCVVRYSTDPNNVTNLGVFIEVEYEIGFMFEGMFLKQGEMSIIYSNLKEVNVPENLLVSRGTLLGKTKRGPTNELRVFLLSEEDVFALQMWTNNNKVKIGDLWYWDPGFLFR